MPIIRIPNAGSVGVIKDVAAHELPPNAWTDALNVRFLDGAAMQFFGHGPTYGAPEVVPLHLCPVNIGNMRYWIYAGEKKIYASAIIDGETDHVNLTRQTSGADVDYSGEANAWTSTVLSGIPILNPGNEVDPPQRWNLDVESRFQTLDNWPANTFCKSMRAYRNFLVALNVTRDGVNLPFNVMWSSPADPGGVPGSWAHGDPTSESGDTDLAEGSDPIVDGLVLRDSLIIYKESSVYRMDFIGGGYVFSFRKVLGVSGAMNRNCIVELDGMHFVLTNSDVVVHDGQSATPVLDKVARRALFQDIDTEYASHSFVFKNPFLNEVYVCYASVGNTVPNKAMVWNYKDRTVTYRDIPALHHAAYGPVDNTLNDSWSSDNDAWITDLTAWNVPAFTPNLMRVLMASADKQLLLLDSSVTFNGTPPASYMERRGLSFGEAEFTKLIVGIRPRITGNPGETVIVRVGGHMTDPAADPEYDAEIEFVIGEDIAVDCMVSYRYLAIRFESGSAVQWKLDSFDIEVQKGGKW